MAGRTDYGQGSANEDVRSGADYRAATYPAGVTILAGKPKIGKSWLALDICAAVAGDRFLLKDNERRLKKRVDKILPPSFNAAK